MSTSSTPTPQEALETTQRWVETVVVGWRLCPFAAPVVRQETLRYVISEARTPEEVYQTMLQEMLLLVEEPEEKIATTLIVTPYTFARLLPFLDFIAAAEATVEQAGLEGILQVASFHPRYLFEDAPRDDVSHFAGRAPYPTIHLLREAHITQAVDGAVQTDDIPTQNIETLRKLGKQHVQEIFQGLYQKPQG
ncbi:MAG: DUF1415 domain-containing protein [Myxococcales bacterium]|nr:DUF1415 domain-containing protein [Myxococcales bacterium]MCB9642861.1 DUF1415 domain-containing protein [Myxococcales bacterium]